MAKRNDVFSYGSAAIPTGESKYSVIRWGWNGLNRTDQIDSGGITDCAGVVIDPPYVTPALVPHEFAGYSEPISVHGFDDRLFVVYRDGGKIKVDCLDEEGNRYTGVLGDALGTEEDFRPRSMVQFNVASNTENIVEAEYVRKLLIFPDRYSMDFDITADFETAYLGDAYPGLNLATVYGSRVFGVDENLVYASSHNDYADWDLDTAAGYSEANAWVSMSQSNVKADGEFTALATYDNHVLLFKKDYLQLVYNNKNPFRIVDVGSYGCDNPYAVTEMDGVLYFASPTAIYSFSGGTPKEIGKDLDLSSCRGAVLGSWDGTMYIYADDMLYSYSDGVWSSGGAVSSPIRQFASCDWGIAALCEDGTIRFVDWLRDGSGGIPGSWPAEYGSSDGGYWWFETDFMAVGKLDVRRVKKLSLLCDVDPGAFAAVYLLKDGEEFDPVTTPMIGKTTGDGRVLLRVLVRMMSAYMHRLRIVGRGKVKIHAAEIQISWGGDVYAEG